MKTYALICFVLSVVSFLGAWLLVHKLDYTVDDTQDKCDADLQKDMQDPSGIRQKDLLIGKSCHAWDGHQCRRGSFKMNGGIVCEADRNVWPMILLAIGVMLFIASIFFFVKQEDVKEVEIPGLNFRR